MLAYEPMPRSQDKDKCSTRAQQLPITWNLFHLQPCLLLPAWLSPNRREAKLMRRTVSAQCTVEYRLRKGSGDQASPASVPISVKVMVPPVPFVSVLPAVAVAVRGGRGVGVGVAGGRVVMPSRGEAAVRVVVVPTVVRVLPAVLRSAPLLVGGGLVSAAGPAVALQLRRPPLVPPAGRGRQGRQRGRGLGG